MKKVFRKIGKVLLIIVGVIIVLIAGLAAYHHVMLGAEAKKLTPPGAMVSVNEHNLHVYAEGAKNDKPTLVFMSGSGTAAPVYNFKPLYSKLSDQFHIAVVEKAGYGYSDICDVPRDIDAILAETREALALAGEKPPYVLLPHSFSGLEAIRWAQKYPEEVSAIVGLDMAVPAAYDNLKYTDYAFGYAVLRSGSWLGFTRILGFLNGTEALTQDEIEQQQYLFCRNAINADVINEAKVVNDSAKMVNDAGLPKVPMLMFTSNGKEIDPFWISVQQSFADNVSAELIYLDCGHYIFQFEPEKIAGKTLEFLAKGV